jgi:hypothetical protein
MELHRCPEATTKEARLPFFGVHCPRSRYRSTGSDQAFTLREPGGHKTGVISESIFDISLLALGFHFEITAGSVSPRAFS